MTHTIARVDGRDSGAWPAWLERVEDIVLVAFLIATGACVSVHVLTDRILHQPATWAADAATVAVTWVAMWGLGVAAREGFDVPLRVLVDPAPGTTERMVLSRVRLGVTAAFLLIVLVGGGSFLAMTWGQTLRLGLVAWPYWPYAAAVPVGAALALVHVLRGLILGREPNPDLELGGSARRVEREG